MAPQGILVETPPAFDPDYPDENVRTQTVSDDSGQAIATIDNAGVIARTYYDGLGRVRYVVRNLVGQGVAVETPPDYDPDYPDQNVRTETVYDAGGDAAAAIDPNGVITRTYYDELHRAETVVQNLTGQSIAETTPPDFNPAYPDQNVRTDTVYGDGGQVARTIDTLGHETVACYDGQYRAVKTVQNPSVGDPCGSYTPSAEADEDITSLNAYDGMGNRLSATDPNGNETTFGYDGVYRVASETDPLTHATQFGYDLNGDRVTLTDAESVATRYEYDALGRMTAVVENYRPGYDPDEETNVRTEYSYDGVGNRLEILDGNSHSTNFTYDDLGRLLTETDALDHTTTYSYDAAGNRASLEDANGYTTTFSYDGLNRLILIDYPSPDADASFSYDAAGNRVEMTDGVGTTEWDYDSLSRPTSVIDPFDDTVGYEYDGLGNRTTLTYPDTSSVSYVYDAASRLESVTDWDSLATTYVYDKAGRLSTVTLPNGIVSTYEYDDAGRLLSLTHADDPITFASYVYTYDDVGNRLTADEAVRQPDESTASMAITYDYDPLYRLTEADYDDETYFHYTYDAVGNRLTEVTESGTTMYQYDIANRLTEVDAVELTWDNNGNLLDDGTSEYTFDHSNRLVSVTQGVDTYVYSYNGLGDRLAQTVNSSPTYYKVDLVAALTQVLADGTNSYLYGLARLGEEQPGGWQYHLGDALGSMRQLANNDAAVTLARSYEPFGDALTSTGPAVTAFQFTGEARDGTGLTYLRARYYASYLNQWIQPDTIVPDPRDPANWNKYTYARDNPVNYTDPSGYIIEGWESERAEAILAELNFSYNVQIKKDWGYIDEFIDTPNLYIDASMGCQWLVGNWRTVDEFELTLAAVEDAAKVLGPEKGFFASAIRSRPVRVYRLPSRTVFGYGAYSIDSLIFPNDVFDWSDDWAKGQVVHELGHVIDYRQWWPPNRLSNGMAAITSSFKEVCLNGPKGGRSCSLVYDPKGQNEAPPTGYGQKNPAEDWAESFKVFVYSSLGNLGAIRRGYIEDFINDLHTP